VKRYAECAEMNAADTRWITASAVQLRAGNALRLATPTTSLSLKTKNLLYITSGSGCNTMIMAGTWSIILTITAYSSEKPHPVKVTLYSN
jgi:hypothetical protein